MAADAETALVEWQGVLGLPENRLALKAAQRIARRGLPLVLIHGPAGVGKSALANGVVRRVIQGPAVRTVQSLPANELGFALDSEHDLKDLIAVDLLIVEDLQHLPASGLASFEKLLDKRRNRATLLTASAGPARLKKLPARIVSRLASGLVVGIEPYSLASRTVILRHAAEEKNLTLESDAFAWLASRPTSGSVRPLLGALDALKARHRGQPTPVTLEQVQAIPMGEPVGVARIVKCVADTYGVKTKELLGPSRLRTVLLPRQVAMFLARDVTSLSLPSIGEQFGGRDHTTVLHAVNKIRTAMADDRELAGTIRQLKLELV